MTRRPTSRLRRSLLILGGLLVLIVLLAAAGSIYQLRASKADRARYKAPGDLVTVRGRQMHIHCHGQGSPTVVLDAGQGAWSIAWADLVPRLDDTTRVCSYDRAGNGWSEPAHDDRSPQVMADDLAALLDAAAIDSPYIIVASSAAALHARLVAAQKPDVVSGLVLIDPATEYDNEILSEDLKRQQRSAVGMFQGFGLAARLGLVRLVNPKEIAPYAPFIAQDPVQPEVYYSYVSTSQWWQTSQQEFSARLNDEALSYVRDNGAFPDIPVVVIGAEHGTGDPELDQQRLVRLRTLAAEATQGKFVLAEGSSHDILRERPEIVTETIRDMVDAANPR